MSKAFVITECVFNKVSLNIEAEEAIEHRVYNTT